MQVTKLSSTDLLPLTCSRSGACCHGNIVMLNPWELYRLATEKKLSPRDFRDLYCDHGGIQLRFDGKVAWGGKKACSQYIENFGCSLHLARPLACRLYPLGRQIQSEVVHYIFQGSTLPCLKGCPEVLDLPHLQVGDYLKGQETKAFEIAQDAYLELMQNIADMAFELLLDTGLAASGDKKTLQQWRKMGRATADNLTKNISQDWLDCLMTPQLTPDSDDPLVFIEQHSELLQIKAQHNFGTLQTNREYHAASVLLMAIALHLARSLGIHTETLVSKWCDTAIQHGAEQQ